MYIRTIVALLLITLMSFPAPSLDRPQTEAGQDQEEDLSVDPYDRYEALEIARDLKKKLEETSDITPLIDKYFVSDFDERFAREAVENYWFPAKPKILAQADKEDVRRYYIALTNFSFLFMRLAYTLEKQQKDKNLAEGGPADEEVQEVEKLFPKDVIDALKSNSYLSGLISNNRNDESSTSTDTAVLADKSAADGVETESGIDEHEVRTLEQLRDLSTAMEIAAVRVRAFLKSLPVEKTVLNYIMPKVDDLEMERLGFAVSENLYITDEVSFYGVPKGTRLVCAAVFSLHIDMLRIDGELKVLSVYMPMSD